MDIDKSKLEFDELSEYYLNQLERNYLEKIETSGNKQYTREYYRAVLFERNPKIPKDSFFFEILTKTFLHFFRLNTNSEDAVLATFDNLYEIKERAKKELLLALELYEAESISDEEIYSIQSMVEKENHLLSLEYYELSDLLAFFLAIRKLLEKYPKDEKIELFSIDAPLEDKPRSGTQRIHDYTLVFTERQQMFALYFLMEQLGLSAARDYNKSDLARFAHLLSKQPWTKLDNSGKYKTLKNLMSKKSSTQNINDLDSILGFFEALDLQKAVKMINAEIEYQQKKQ